MFVGFGYDVHRFKKSRKLFLGGVEISSKNGLDGHSDADVLIHALMDALLGASGQNDIGHLFPNTDDKYKNIPSVELLKIVVNTLKEKKCKLINTDMTIVAEKPKIYPYIDEMKNILSKILGIKRDYIAIKATTNEKMGFIGRAEGIAAMAVVSLERKIRK
ncbi:MAG: 2-C-methyl-D-erythritol 2,4-cyclodiphosphate synthase [Endomicrobiia bacterium]|nr:2-C-methyl-D-erythritol 2,4-cyclodiphosphate synthase [Endomicrobiaceae bacterium]MDD3052794.1 2-C-methyl-D-erythritol 2,4-cyclodiphosphate synthase [Endomicrobiaceae bacterium]MDD3921926.1 2-C-methyl-D-erythritol 2,4-cyclodiphosphate synthase [Endomicrobiaceae bacterium]